MKAHLRSCLWLAWLLLAACGKSDPDPAQNLAGRAQVAIVSQAPGVTPFIQTLSISLERYGDLASVAYTIAPKPGTWSRPVSVTYDKAWLDRKNAYAGDSRLLTLPVFGLYANFRNDVNLVLTFSDNSSEALNVQIDTPAYAGAATVYGTPTIKVARTSAPVPGLDFIFMHNQITTPVVIDSDGNLRWVGTGLHDSYTSLFAGDSFLVGSGNTPELYRMDLDSTFITTRIALPSMKWFHHDLLPGKSGLLAEIDALENGVEKVESVLAEIGPAGQVIKQWDMATIFREYMQSHGDDPSNFVIDGIDWFHMNSAIYNAADDSLLVSSRENFVVKLDYETGRIKWLLGDTTKHWYADYPSLRALALTVAQGNPPIGQHALSIMPDGELLLFNNGTASLHAPPGTAPGLTLPFSAPVMYRIDEQARVATATWTYENAPSLVSEFCSSVRQGGADNYLVAYAMTDARTHARLIAVDKTGKVSFDFDYPSVPCSLVFLASPIDLAAVSLK